MHEIEKNFVGADVGVAPRKPSPNPQLQYTVKKYS